MFSKEPHCKESAETSKLMAASMLSPVELTETMLNRIKQVDPYLFSCSLPLPELAQPMRRGFCKDQIVRYKMPRYIEFMQEFPMTATGKPQKFSLREQLVSKYGLRIIEAA